MIRFTISARLRKLSALLAFCAPLASPGGQIRLLDDRVHHLGAPSQREWDIFTNQPPASEELHLTFDAHRNTREFTLFVRQDDVKQDWTVKLNGKRLGALFLMEADLIQTLSIPAEALQEGTNEMSITTRKLEDVLIRGIALGDDAAEKLAAPGAIKVQVREAGAGAIPCRLTLINENGALAPVFAPGQTHLAIRPGVVYTADGSASIKLLPGRYTLVATRGPEYRSAAVKNVDPQKDQSIELTLERKADTRGWVAADTHIHTLTLSRHGDATLNERMLTLAGEGVELAISTEHNLHADYAEAARTAGVARYFTTVCGNEVTTGTGHFNIFPVETNAPPPDYTLEGWPDLFKAIRSTPRVQVAILNHPTDIHSSFTPFAQTNLNYATGQNLRGDFPFAFDAIEVINSGAMRTDWLEPFRAWFALLNRGYKITAVGASDCHDVSRFIVGQGRTYLRMDDGDPAHLDVDAACRALKAGHAVVSLGLIPSLTLTDQSGKAAGPGDLFTSNSSELRVRMSVDAPLASDQSPRLTLYANGIAVEELELPNARGSHHEVTIPIAKPKEDTFYVLLATIDHDPAPEWGLARPYQPTCKHFELRLIGATNPVWVDADGDGRFSSARDYASAALAKFPVGPDLFAYLGAFNFYVAAQCAELLESRGLSLETGEIPGLLKNSAQPVQEGFAAYRAGRKRQGNPKE